MPAHSNEYFGSSSSSSASGSGPFLEELQARGIGVEDFHTEDAESKVVIALADGTPKDLSSIMEGSGCIPLGQLLETMGKVQRFGLVTKAGEAGNEIFSLSPSGVRIARMMGVWRGNG